jgi:hypothetical protein
MFLVWGMILFFILMVLVGNMNHEEDKENIYNNPLFEEVEELEGDESEEFEDENTKTHSTPLWKYVRKLEDGREGGTTKFYTAMDVNPMNLASDHILM